MLKKVVKYNIIFMLNINNKIRSKKEELNLWKNKN